jgi:hypothetical protein
MVPMGEHVDQALAEWKGAMGARLDEVEKRFGRIESAIAEQKTDVMGAIKGVSVEVGKLDTKVDGLNDRVTVLTVKASMFAVMGGLVASVFLTVVQAYGNKLIGGG